MDRRREETLAVTDPEAPRRQDPDLDGIATGYVVTDPVTGEEISRRHFTQEEREGIAAASKASSAAGISKLETAAAMGALQDRGIKVDAASVAMETNARALRGDSRTSLHPYREEDHLEPHALEAPRVDGPGRIQHHCPACARGYGAQPAELADAVADHTIGGYKVPEELEDAVAAQVPSLEERDLIGKAAPDPYPEDVLEATVREGICITALLRRTPQGRDILERVTDHLAGEIQKALIGHAELLQENAADRRRPAAPRDPGTRRRLGDSPELQRRRLEPSERPSIHDLPRGGPPLEETVRALELVAEHLERHEIEDWLSAGATIRDGLPWLRALLLHQPSIGATWTPGPRDVRLFPAGGPPRAGGPPATEGRNLAPGERPDPERRRPLPGTRAEELDRLARPLEDTIRDLDTAADAMDAGDTHATILEALDWLRAFLQEPRETGPPARDLDFLQAPHLEDVDAGGKAGADLAGEDLTAAEELVDAAGIRTGERDFPPIPEED